MHLLNLINYVLIKETINAAFDSGDKLDETALEKKSLCVSDTSHYDLDKMENKADSNFPAGDNTQSCSEGDASPMNSDSRCLGVSLDDTSVMSSSLVASNDLKNSVSIERNTCADFESGDKLAELTSDRKRLIISDVSGDGQEENKPELASLVKENIQSCEEGNVGDAHGLNLNETTSGEHKISISIEEAKSVVCQLENEFSELASQGEHHFDLGANHSAVDMETKPLVDSLIKTRSQSSTEDVHTVNTDVACIESVPPTTDSTVDNSDGKVDEGSVVSVSASNGANGNSMQVNFEPNDEIACEGGSKLDVASEAVSETKQCEVRSPHAPADDFRTDMREGKTESCSV